MNFEKIRSFVYGINEYKCSFTQDIVYGGITNNWPREIVEGKKKPIPSELYFYVGPNISYYDYNLSEEGDTLTKWTLDDLKPHGEMGFWTWLKKRAIPLQSRRTVISKFLRYLVETYGIVSVDIDDIPPKFDDGHCFVLVQINKKIYIIDSYASIRLPEMREFDFESFDDYVTTGSIDSYNKTFNVHIKGETAIDVQGIQIHIGVSES